MAQQSTTLPREAPRKQGRLTREQQRRVARGDEKTAGADLPPGSETLDEAARRPRGPARRAAYEITTGDRSVQRGANDGGPHDKSR